MAKKRYSIKTGCPQCGCSGVQALSEEEMRERYGEVPNFDMECSECMAKYSADMKPVNNDFLFMQQSKSEKVHYNVIANNQSVQNLKFFGHGEW